jgi:hypothetical protein
MIRQTLDKLLHLAAAPLRWAFEHSGMVGGTAIDPDEIEEDLREHYLNSATDQELLLQLLDNAGIDCQTKEQSHGYGGIEFISFYAHEASRDKITACFQEGGGLDGFLIQQTNDTPDDL